MNGLEGRDRGFKAPFAAGVGKSHEQHCESWGGNHQERNE